MEEFNLWSDHDVHSRPEYEPRLIRSDEAPWWLEAIVLTALFHPRCKADVVRPVERLATVEDYVWLLGGRRFMFSAEECV